MDSVVNYFLISYRRKITVAKSEKIKALELALTQIEKSHGKGSIMRYGEKAAVEKLDVIPTGCLSLDHAMLIGGFPKGRVTEIFGPEASGKTTLALHAVAEAQKMDGVAAYIDAEHALDPNYTRNIGVNLDELLISQPDFGEQALDIVETLVRSSAVDIIVIDSVAALTPKAEIEGEMGDSFMGLHARLMSQALRKLTAITSKSQTCVMFINQIREKIGVMFGPTETTTGGRALKFYTTIRIEVRKITSIKEGNEVIGNRTIAKVVKNKLAPPFKSAEFDIIYGKGISKEGDLIDLASNLNIVEKSGSWYSFEGERVGQGKENFRKILQDNKDLYNKLYEIVRAKLFTAQDVQKD